MKAKKRLAKVNYVRAIRWWIGLTILFYLILIFVFPGKWIASHPILLATVFGILAAAGTIGITVCALYIIPFKSKKAEGNMSIFFGVISVMSLFLVGGYTIWLGAHWTSGELSRFGVRTTGIVIDYFMIPLVTGEPLRSIQVAYKTRDGRIMREWNNTIPKEIYLYRHVGDTLNIMYSSRYPDVFMILFDRKYLDELEKEDMESPRYFD